eukprot:1349142-Amorphochlora_amoeboformis.AAC.1
MSLRIIQNFGAVTAETNKALRRLITVFASIIQYVQFHAQKSDVQIIGSEDVSNLAMSTASLRN